MLFNSFQFLVFFPLVTLIYFLLPHKLRWFHLLVASCVFYMAFVPIYIIILFATIVIDYYAGILIENAPDSRRRLYLSMSIFANVGVLFFFKYYNFFADNFNQLFAWSKVNADIPLLKIILPIGLSFHTFQAMSYTIEVYRRKQKAEKHFGIYALYVMFYPQLVAGPIERPQNMLHQFHEKHIHDNKNVIAGLRLIIWGLFKKTVIADRLALLTDKVFADPRAFSSEVLITAAIFFSFQIFCDFSGYSNIALGTARVMGFDLMVNFNWPFSAKSISEFWRKWHISLSTWFNDYLFTPIAQSTRDLGIYAVVIASLATFMVSGLWHGAAWTYVAMGALHGVAVAYEVLTKKTRKKIFKKIPKSIGDAIGLICTFSYVTFAFIFFRARTMSDAFYIVGKIPTVFTEMINRGKPGGLPVAWPIGTNMLRMCVLSICLLQFIYLIQKKRTLTSLFDSQSRPIRWVIYYGFVLTILYLGVFQNRQFIYFQF